MAFTPQVRTIVTKAQKPEEYRHQEHVQHQTTPHPLNRSPTIEKGRLQYTLPTGTSSTVFTPPPHYQELPANLRPLYYGGKDIKTAASTPDHDHYPPQDTKSLEDGQSHRSIARRKISFWRTKKGIVFIVIFSNIIILGAVLGGILAARLGSHHRHWSGHDNNGTVGSSSSTNQHDTAAPTAAPAVSALVPNASPLLSATSAPSVSASSPNSQTTATSQAGGNSSGAGAANGQGAAAGSTVGDGTPQGKA